MLFQISDCQPVDDLCKMPDSRRDIQEFAQNLAILKSEEGEQGKKQTKYFIIESGPYFKKQNLTSDKAQWNCWNVHSRTETYDLYVTVLRRKYIPPLMEVFQDIICISQFDFSQEMALEGDQVFKKSNDFLRFVHHLAVDSLHPASRITSMFKNLIDEKSSALVMDEETIEFNHYNLNVLPNPGIVHAVNYLESILSILGKYNTDLCKDLKRQIK